MYLNIAAAPPLSLPIEKPPFRNTMTRAASVIDWNDTVLAVPVIPGTLHARGRQQDVLLGNGDAGSAGTLDDDERGGRPGGEQRDRNP